MSNPAEQTKQLFTEQDLRRAVDGAPYTSPSPSLRAAQQHRREPERYSTAERAAAQYALDFNGVARNALTFIEQTAFPGFPALSLLAQLAEYRAMHETLADECIRMWGRVASRAVQDTDECQQIEAELVRLDARQIIRRLVIADQAFGGGHVFFKIRGDDDIQELPLLLTPASIPRGSFEYLTVIQPIHLSPNAYNTTDCTRADYYKPTSWTALGRPIHASRMATVISREVPDELKPVYSFRGISMSQLAMPYVDNWLRTRQSVSDTVKQFSVSGVKADLAQMLQPGGSADLASRAELLNRYRDNRNIMFLDNATEEFFQVNTPLGSLDTLQAQAQEHMIAVCHIPRVVLLGIAPSGFNASSDGEMRVFYDHVRGYQTNVLSAVMQKILQVVQLSLFGAIDPDVHWEWTSPVEPTLNESAEARARDADADIRYIDAGVLRPDQVTRVLSSDVRSRYAGVANEPIDELPNDDIEAITERLLNIPVEPAAVGTPGPEATGDA